MNENMIQITEYTVIEKLSNLLEFENGQPVKTPADFERKKEEIKNDALEIQYGKLPPAPEFLEVEPVFYHRTEKYATYRITTGTREKPLNFYMYYLRSNGNGKNPVVIDGDLCWWNFVVHDDFLDTFLQNGIDLVFFDRTLLSNDVWQQRRRDGRGHGQLHETYPDYDFGQIAAWAWGYSRCIDALEILDICDLSYIAATGHSRGAKTALLAGILDERIAITNPNAACIGGGGCYRITMKATDEYGTENLKSEDLFDFLKAGSIDWFGPKLADYAGREQELPFDIHSLKALVAPRVLFISEGASDIMSNPVGAWQTTMAAKEVYKLHGKEENLIWYYRPGGHAHTVEDAQQLVNVIRHIKFGEPLNDKFFKTPFPAPELAFDWRYR